MHTPTRPTDRPEPPHTTGSGGTESGLNVAVLAGTLVAEPVLSELSTGETVASFSVRSLDTNGRKCSSPVRWMNPGSAVHRIHTDQNVVIVGRVVRRFFRSGGQVVSRTEVVASKVTRPSQRITRTKALEGVAAAITEFAERS